MSGGFDPADAVSLAPQTLYAEGGLFGARLDQLEPAPTGALTPLHPAYAYTRPEPLMRGDATHIAEFQAHYRLLDAAYRRGAATVSTVLDGALLFGGGVHLRVGDHWRVLYETFRPNDRHTVPLLTGEAEGAQTLDPDVTWLHLASAGSFNYGHWLLDDVPALLAAERFDGPLGLLLPDYGPGLVARKTELIEALALPGAPAITLIDPRLPVRAPRLLYVSPSTYHPFQKSPDAMAWVADRVGPALLAHSTTDHGARIFVGRGGGHGRRLLNEAELAEQLAARGFAYVVPETLSAADQAAAFAGAEVIVGAMGAGMTNSVFAPPGVAVVHLAPERWIEPFYWDLAAARGHRYAVVYGPSDAAAEPSWADYSIDAAAMDAVLEELAV